MFNGKMFIWVDPGSSGVQSWGPAAFKSFSVFSNFLLFPSISFSNFYVAHQSFSCKSNSSYIIPNIIYHHRP